MSDTTLREELITMAKHLRDNPEVGPTWGLSSEEIRAMLRYADTESEAYFKDAVLAAVKAIRNVTQS